MIKKKIKVGKQIQRYVRDNKIKVDPVYPINHKLVLKQQSSGSNNGSSSGKSKSE